MNCSTVEKCDWCGGTGLVWEYNEVAEWHIPCPKCLKNKALDELAEETERLGLK